MSRRPGLVALLVLLAYGCASIDTCQPGDARLKCRPSLPSMVNDVKWGW